MNRFNIIIVALLFISCNEDSKQNHLVLKTEKPSSLILPDKLQKDY